MKAFLIVGLFSMACYAQTARQYYDELYKAGGLDRMADKYICFDDEDELKTFFIFAESKDLREFLTADGTMNKFPKAEQERLKKNFLIVRGYDKGVLVGDEQFYDADGASWTSEDFFLDKVKKTKARMRLTVTWETLRYKRSVEILKSDSSLKQEVSRYGRCERVSAQVAQHGNP